MDSPTPTLVYTVIYLAIVWAGPKIMKHRKAFKLTWALVPYNLSMAALNGYIAMQVSPQSKTYSFIISKLSYVNVT